MGGRLNLVNGGEYARGVRVMRLILTQVSDADAKQMDQWQTPTADLAWFCRGIGELAEPA